MPAAITSRDAAQRLHHEPEKHWCTSLSLTSQPRLSLQKLFCHVLQKTLCRDTEEQGRDTGQKTMAHVPVGERLFGACSFVLYLDFLTSGVLQFQMFVIRMSFAIFLLIRSGIMHQLAHCSHPEPLPWGRAGSLV